MSLASLSKQHGPRKAWGLEDDQTKGTLTTSSALQIEFVCINTVVSIETDDANANANAIANAYANQSSLVGRASEFRERERERERC